MDACNVAMYAAMRVAGEAESDVVGRLKMKEQWWGCDAAGGNDEVPAPSLQ